jgi:hypothetical protein
VRLWLYHHHGGGGASGGPGGGGKRRLTETPQVSAGHGLTPSHQAEPAGCRVAALSRFQTLIAAIDNSSDESSFSS